MNAWRYVCAYTEPPGRGGWVPLITTRPVKTIFAYLLKLNQSRRTANTKHSAKAIHLVSVNAKSDPSMGAVKATWG